MFGTKVDCVDLEDSAGPTGHTAAKTFCSVFLSLLSRLSLCPMSSVLCSQSSVLRPFLLVQKDETTNTKSDVNPK